MKREYSALCSNTWPREEFEHSKMIAMCRWFAAKRTVTLLPWLCAPKSGLQGDFDVAGTTNLVEGRASVGLNYLCYLCEADWSIPVRLLFRVLLAGSCCATAVCGLK